MKKILKRGMSGLLAVLMAFTVLAGFGTTTAFAASETAESYMISFPRDGDAAQIYSEDAWGHSAKSYMNGWATGSSNYTTLHCMDSFDGKVCYCIEPGLSRNVGDTYHGFGEDFWDNYPASTTTPSSRTILSCCWAVSCSMAIRATFPPRGDRRTIPMRINWPTPSLPSCSFGKRLWASAMRTLTM